MTHLAAIGNDLAATRLAARYGGPAQVPPPAWNDTLDLLLDHRSVRRFLPDALPANVVETLLAAAQSARFHPRCAPFPGLADRPAQAARHR